MVLTSSLLVSKRLNTFQGEWGDIYVPPLSSLSCLVFSVSYFSTHSFTYGHLPIFLLRLLSFFLPVFQMHVKTLHTTVSPLFTSTPCDQISQISTPTTSTEQQSWQLPISNSRHQSLPFWSSFAELLRHGLELPTDLCWRLPRPPSREVPYGECPKAHRSWVSLHTLSPSQNTMIHSFSHQVHVIILKPQSLTSTAHMTLPPRSIITWKSTYIKIHFQRKRVLSSLFPSREKTTFQLQSHKCSVQLLTPLSTSTDMPHSPFALEFLWSVVQDV